MISSKLSQRFIARRLFSCAKIHKMKQVLDNIFARNGERVSSALEDLHADHALPLSLNFLQLDSPSHFGFLADLNLKSVQAIGKYTDITKSSPKLSLLTECVQMLEVLLARIPKAILNEDELLLKSLRAVRLNYVVLGSTDKKALKEALKKYAENEEIYTEDIRVEVKLLQGQVQRVDSLDNARFSNEFVQRLGLAGFRETEKQYEMVYNDHWGCLELTRKENMATISLFGGSQIDQISQIHQMKALFEETPNLESLIIDQSPIVHQKKMDYKDRDHEKIMEFSQSIIKKWPYLYQFRGKAELRGYYLKVVFDKEYYTERDGLYYYNITQKNKVLDRNNSILVHYMGSGVRPKDSSLYLSSVITEERIIEAAGRIDSRTAARLSSLYDVFALAGGLNLFKTSSVHGCEHCGGRTDNAPYYFLMDKIYEGELAPVKLGKINADVSYEAMMRLRKDHRAVMYTENSNYVDSLHHIMENIRQTRLSGYSSQNYKRSEHIKSVFQATQNYKHEDFYLKLAYLENIFGTLESTICQFIDMVGNKENLVKYQEFKTGQVERKVLSDWDPLYTDEDRDLYCMTENWVLPAKVDDSLPANLTVYYEADRNQETNFGKSVKEQIERQLAPEEGEAKGKRSQAQEEGREGRGRKIRLKAKGKPGDDY